MGIKLGKFEFVEQISFSYIVNIECIKICNVLVGRETCQVSNY